MAYAEFRTTNQKSVNLKFCTPFNERTFIGRNPGKIPKMREKKRIKQKSKVSTVDIEVKRSGYTILKFSALLRFERLK